MLYDFQGQAIRLPWERWLHIITRKDHPYMVHLREEMDGTLRDPDVIVRSTRKPEIGRIYNKRYERTAVGSKWVRVVVYFIDASDAFVVTAYVDDDVISGEVLWRRVGL